MSLAGQGPLTSTPGLPQDRYWASVEAEQLPQVLLSKAMRYRDRLRRDGRLDLFRRSERLYYGQDADGGMANSSAVQFGGEAGELILIRVNHLRSLVQGVIATVVNRRLSYDPRATNNDSESARQVALAKSLLEYYGRILEDDTRRVETLRSGLMFGEGYTSQRWNVTRGRPLTTTGPAPAEGEQEAAVMFEGDLDAQTFNPVEVIHDIDMTERELKWVMLPYRANIWDLAAQYPEQSDEILKIRGSAQQRWPRSAWTSTPFEKSQSAQEADIVTTWWFYHLPTPALPQGRHAQIVGDVLLHDGPMELERIPVRRIAPEVEMSISRGHSPVFDLLALQQAYDSIMDTELSMIDAYGMQSVIVPKDSDFSPEQLSKGLQLLEWTPDPELANGGKPEILNLMQMPTSLPTTREGIKHEMETILGINSVVRGDPLPQLKSGAALALVQSLAVAFNTNLQAEVTAHDEGVASDRLMILKRYATNKRTIETVGRTNRGSMSEWSADDLSTVQRVTIELGSPLQDQTAGKLEIAQSLLQNHMLVDRKGNPDAGKYFEVLTTGRLEPALSGPKDEEDLIIDENEALADGSAPVTVKVTDDHGAHVISHKSVLKTRYIRNDPAACERVMQHILLHERTLSQMDPFLAALTNQSVPPPPPPMPLPMPMGPPGPHGPPGDPPHPGPHAPLHDKAPNAHRSMPLGQGANTSHASPIMPTNPLTGGHAPNPGQT